VEEGVSPAAEAVEGVAVAGKSSFILKLIVAIFGIFALAYFLSATFSGKITVDPVLFTLGSLRIRWYGILIAFAVFISYLIIIKRFERSTDTKHFDLIFIITLFSGLIGARVGYIVQNLPYFFSNPADIIKIYHGGLSIHGGIIAGVLALYLTTRFLKINFIKVANLFSPEVLLCFAIGRFGNFFNKEIIGQPTNGLIKMYIDPMHRPTGFEKFSYFHPVFIYESILLIILYFYLTSKYDRVEKSGLIYLLIGYPSIRIIIEFFRIDYRPILGPFDLAQIVSFGIILLTLAVTLTFKKK